MSSTGRRLALGTAASSGLAALLALAADVRLHRTLQPVRRDWQRVPIAPRGATRLGISLRLPQVAAYGLALRPTLERLLDYPFEVLRLGAYWSHIEPAADHLEFDGLDWQVTAAARAGKQIILGLGALKNFGYPEFFVPRHRLAHALPERQLIRGEAYPELLGAACAFIQRLVERYRDQPAVIAWQVEHEAVDPLGLEHSWRLSRAFVQAEVDAVRQMDPSRPILLNGFLPASLPVLLSQWWQTRDQGDSLQVAQEVADIVGLDYYPRSALVGLGGLSAYLDGGGHRWNQARRERIFARARANGQRLMVSEGQAEPWEAVTVPPNRPRRVPWSCTPRDMIDTYNRCLGWSRAGPVLEAYLFWGAEWWLVREQRGDPSYLGAFARILTESS